LESNLYFEPIRQESWYLQIKEKITYSKRSIDKMSIAEIIEMYQNKNFLCDSCGKKLGKNNFTLEDHITHLINPIVLWNCDDCIIKDIHNGKIMGQTETEPEDWQTSNV